ncbi:MAG: hypothetical protein HFG42_06015 [Lachnospiraceae bacterium]|nr:hypothetical protein [Lachnospiraceae bacterium]
MWNVENVAKLTFSDAYIDDKTMYVSHNAYNGLFKIDRNNYKATFVRKFENEEIGKPSLHSRITKWGESLFFFPFWANGISRYDIRTGEMEHYDLENYHTIDILEKKEKIILFPCYLNQSVMAFYPECKRLTIDHEWTKMLRKYVFHLDYRGFARINRVNGKIYIGMSRTTILLEIDENNIENYKVINLEMQGNTIYDIFTDNKERLWITTFSGTEIYEYDIKNGDTIQISDTVCTVIQKYIFLQNKRIFVVSAEKENRNIGIINGVKVELYSVIPKDQKIIEDFRFDFNIINGNIKQIKDTFEVFQCPVNQTQALLIQDGRIRTQEFFADISKMNIDEIIQARKTYTISLHSKLQETAIITLYSFINSIKEQGRQKISSVEKCGDVIYQKCLL